ncbi:MAG: HRDC domain-containing protein [Dehalococcoidia bacterium]
MCDNCQAEDHPEQDSLSKKLSALCRRLSERYDREPYELIEARTIQELAAYRPRTQEELLDTWGIGEVKAGWFGKDILNAIREWESVHPASPPREVRRQLRKRLTTESTLPVEDRLYQLLTEWRRDRADRDGVPAYVICNNQTLREITVQRPQDEHALAAVWGLGQARIERYGEEILALVNPSRLFPPRK